MKIFSAHRREVPMLAESSQTEADRNYDEFRKALQSYWRGLQANMPSCMLVKSWRLLIHFETR
jgi:hypothetical protein